MSGSGNLAGVGFTGRFCFGGARIIEFARPFLGGKVRV